MPISLQKTKAKAERMRIRALGMGLSITTAQAYELVATVFGDESWSALKARLARQDSNPPKVRPAPSNSAANVQPKAPLLPAPMSKLSLYSVSMYMQTEDGSRRFLQHRTVLCSSQQQAEDYLFEKYFPSEYLNHDYAHAVYVTEVHEELGNDNVPALDELAQWLKEHLENATYGVALTQVFWAWAAGRGASCPEGDARLELGHVERALRTAAAATGSAVSFFASLYKVLPSWLVYSHGDEDSFCGSFLDDYAA